MVMKVLYFCIPIYKLKNITLVPYRNVQYEGVCARLHACFGHVIGGLF